MNNVFDLRRFGKYFMYDLKNAWSNYGITAITVGLMPLILLIFHVIFSLIFEGGVHDTIDMPGKVLIIVVVIVAVILSAPVKLYGSLTERRAGSDWLMIPASSFEKFLSMALILCLVLPLAVFGLASICDLFLGWAVPVYGDSMIRVMGDGFFGTFYPEAVSTGIDESGFTRGGLISLVWLSWCASILPFALGAVCFRKAKSAKTILCLIAFNMLLSILMVFVFKNSSSDSLETFFSDITAEKAQFWANFLVNTVYLVIVGGLLAALYFRVRTIKQ